MMITISKLEFKDTPIVKDMLITSTALVTQPSNVIKELLVHINNGIALKLCKEDKIIGIWCSIEKDTYTSLSYFYIHQDYRKTTNTLKFFLTGCKLINKSKPIVIKANNTIGFDRFFTRLSDTLYIFKGLK